MQPKVDIGGSALLQSKALLPLRFDVSEIPSYGLSDEDRCKAEEFGWLGRSWQCWFQVIVHIGLATLDTHQPRLWGHSLEWLSL